MMAMTDTFWLLSLVFVAMVPIALLLKSTRRQVGPIHMERASPLIAGCLAMHWARLRGRNKIERW